ncbi:MAG TPA: efflux transporter outer membrane subunit [Bryobacteraceae bacterium]|nr:efflux transporter outer membrane subunit [Bryobacteraceae bacterium]
MSTLGSRAAAALCALAMTGCVIGPAYQRPAVTTPTAFREQQQTSAGANVANPKWWETFGDAQLNALEEKVSVSNQNVAAAAAAVEAARAVVREARSQYYPTVTVNPSLTNVHLAIPGASGIPAGKTYNEYAVPFEATWEPDLWGRVKKAVQSSGIAVQIQTADLENVRLAAQADLATDYYELRTEDALKALLDAATANYRETLELNRSLLAAGVGNDEAVAQAETQLKITEAQATAVGVLRAEYEHAIALLVGQAPTAVTVAPLEWKPNPPAIPSGVPSELLQRRPDIAAAERAVAQANVQIGIAKTAYYPSVTLTAEGGPESLALTSLPSKFWSLGPSLVETIFEGGLRKATVQQYQAAYDQTVANYRQTVLTAFGQVEDNLAALRVLGQVVGQQKAAIEAAARTLDEATARYKGGLDPYLNVLSAQIILLNAQETLLSFNEQQMTASVALIKALGGGYKQ